MSKYKLISIAPHFQDIEDMESRVSATIDSGFVLDATGKMINIYTPEGLNILGNIIEGNIDSCNPDFYGSIDVFARKIFGYNLDPSIPYQIVPSALEFYSTSMRDPAFYRLYKRILSYYYRYYLQDYNYTCLPIKITTFFQQYEYTFQIQNASETIQQERNRLSRIKDRILRGG